MPRPVIDYRTGSKEAYLRFQEQNPSIEITYDTYRKVIYKYNSLIIKHLIETGQKVKMPFGLGELVINKYKPKRYRKAYSGVEVINLPINWQETKKQGKYVYFLNAHTEGYKFYFMWSYQKARLKYSFIWKFEMSRINTRLLASHLKDPECKYKDMYREHPRTK